MKYDMNMILIKVLISVRSNYFKLVIFLFQQF